MAKRVMTGLKLARIAAVDRPCQEGALAAITKGAQTLIAKAYTPFAKGESLPLPPVIEYLKREFDADQMKEMLAKGVVMLDCSLPIETRADLKKALQAVIRCKDVVKGMAHITARARAMDATSILPAEWKSKSLELLGNVTHAEAMEAFADPVEKYLGEMGAADFNTEMAEQEAREYANGLLGEIDEATCCLREVFWEINDDPAVADKQKALQESFEQFKAHIQGIIPEGLENAMVAAALVEAGFKINEGGALTKRGDDEMGYSLELKKSLGLAVTATDADVNKALEVQKAAAEFGTNVAKMSPDHVAYMAKAEQLQEATGVKKQEFAALTEAARDEIIKKFPMKDDAKAMADAKAKEEADKKAKKAADDIAKGADESITVDGTVILKSVVGESQFAMFKSMNAKLEKAADEQAIAVIAKRASTELKGISKNADEIGTLLHGIAKVAPALATQVEDILKAASAQIEKGSLFKEVGKSTTGTGGGDAATQIESLAQAEVTKGTAKNIYKARDMVRKANPVLAKQEEEQRKEAQARKAA